MKYLILILSIGWCASSTLCAQKVTINYPFGLTKTSLDNGQTWQVSRPDTISFHYPFGSEKFSSDNGRSWKVRPARRITFSYPRLLSKTSVDKGRNWVISPLEEAQQQITAFPNPAGDFTHLEPAERKLLDGIPELYRLNGQKLGLPDGSDFMENGSYRLNTAGLEDGYYIIRFKKASGYVSTKIMVRH